MWYLAIPNIMPSRSERHQLLTNLDQLIKLLASEESLLRENPQITSDIDELMAIRTCVQVTRYLDVRKYLKQKRTMADLLFTYDDKGFKAEVRMDKESFIKIVDILGRHRVFHNNLRNAQTPVWIQCFVVFRRFGCNGNGNSITRNAHHSGFSEGAVIKFTERVVTSILSLQHLVIKWPDERERKSIKQRFQTNFGIKGAVSIVDGTPAVLAQKPGIDGETYFSRKGIYCINLQLLCDDRGFIRHFITGWPGSVFDNTVFEQARISRHPDQYFSPGEFLLADSGYALKLFCMVPYRQPYSNYPHNQIFNELFSSARVKIEHVNGILKGRWGSLKGISTQVKKKRDFLKINRQIISCLVLHNILLFLNDDWDTDDDDDDDDEEGRNEDVADPRQFVDSDEGAKQQRINVQNYCLDWYFNK